MNDCQFYVWLRKVRCVTAREVAERLGISRKSARNRLERLTRVGAVERRKIGRVVLYCLNKIPLTVGYARKIRARVEQVVELLARNKCIATSVVMRELGLNHTEAYYTLRLLQTQGCAVEMVLGRVAIWCISRNAANELLEELRETAVQLVKQHRLRYVTPKRLYTLVARDHKAQELFSRVIGIGNKPSTAMYTALKALLGAVYGDPLSRSVFYAAQPIADVNVDVREADVQIPGEAANVKFRLPLEEAKRLRRYAERRRTSVSAVVRRAIEQLLARYR